MSSKASSSAVTKRKHPQISFLTLPYDLVLNCLARVSRLDYRMLSQVSQQFKSIIKSSDLYETRARLNCKENCLYLCLNFKSNPNPVRFTRYRNVTNKESCYGVQIPYTNDMVPMKSSSLVAVGYNIYKIGGSDEPWRQKNSSYVSVLDCRSHTWRQAPNMSMERNSSSTACLVDGKIYVAGGCKDKYVHVSDPRWIEVFDPKTKTWENVTNPRVFELHDEYRGKGFITKSFEIEGKLYMFGDWGAVYDPKDTKWNVIEYHHNHGLMRLAVSYNYCVVDDVLLYWNDHERLFKWYDLKEGLWKVLKGVEGLPDFPNQNIKKLVDLGGKMAVLWEEYTEDRKEVRILCAEITLEKRDGNEIWGKVALLGILLRVALPNGLTYSFDALSASV